MRWILLCAALAAANAQTKTSETVYFDGTGGRFPASQISSSGNAKSETFQTVNGRAVPAELSEQKVLSDDGRVKTIERTTRRFDQDGNALAGDRVIETVTMLPDGSSTKESSVYRKDVNGNMQLVERARSETRKSGNVETTTATVEQPSINGTLQVAERSTTSKRDDARSTTVYRPDQNGEFREASRETVEIRKSGEQTVENAAKYVAGQSGRLELAEQTVKTSVKGAGGRESTVVDMYTMDTPVIAGGETQRPRLKQQQVIEKSVTAAGATETVSIRQPSMGNGDLGPARKVSETRCTGKCE